MHPATAQNLPIQVKDNAGLAEGGRNWFLPLVLTSLNQLAENPSGKKWQKLAKIHMTKTVGFLVHLSTSNEQMCVWMLLGCTLHFASLVFWLVIA